MKIEKRSAAAAAALCVFSLLVACGPTASSSSGRSATASDQPSIAPISVAPPDETRPLEPGASGTEYMPNGLPALAPSRGVNADLLFAEKIADDNARFKRLENAVTDLRREFEAVKPAIIRLSAVESDMEDLVTQLQSLVGSPGNAPAPVHESVLPPPAPLIRPPSGSINIHNDGDIPDIGPREIGTMSDSAAAELMEMQSLKRKPTAAPKHAEPAKAQPVKTTPEKTVAATPATSGQDPAVLGVRVGEHADKTRIVIDVTKRTVFTHNLDNSEHVLMVELPTAEWIGPLKDTIKKSPLLTSWDVAGDGKGRILVIQLKNNAEVVSASSLEAKSPDKDGAPFRIIFDLKKTP